MMKISATLRRHPRPYCIAVALLLPCLLGVPNPVTAQTQAPIDFGYTYHVFAYDDTTSLVEVAYEFSERGLAYTGTSADGKTVGKLYLRVQFRDTLGNLVTDYDWIVVNPKPSGPDGGSERMLMGIKNFAIKSGAYLGRILLRDALDPKRQDSAGFSITVPSFSGRHIIISDVEIASEITPTGNTGDLFFKNGHRVVPNLTGVVAPPDMTLRTYAEVYNANHIPADQYSVVYVLADSAGKAFYQKDEMRTRPKADAAPELNAFPMNMLPSGRYFLVVKIFNAPRRAATDSMKVLRSFNVFNPTVDDSLRALARLRDAGAAARSFAIDPMYAGLSEKELDERYGEIKYVATAHERQLWTNLTGVQPKGMFLSQFWARRDPTPGTAENEERDRYYKRLRSAQLLYTSTQTPRGWDSDRGRILLQYGNPDGVERHPLDVNHKPYEIWTYNNVNYSFYFVDRPQTGNYTLVNSTAPEEIHNDNWEDRAKLDPHAN